MNDEKKKIVPELRFPEFENRGAWQNDIMGNVAAFLKGKGISKSDIVSDGVQPCIRYGELYTHYNEVIDLVISKTNLPKKDLVLSQKNDVIIPSSGETQEDIATSSCVLSDGIALGGDINIIRSNINGIFLSYFLNNAKKEEIAKTAQGNAVVHLYINQLEKLEIEFPEPDEQQKIANCLSSLDDLIVAENDKLEVLKDHKKGLLQQLFPAEGETIPKLRFPEFEKDGEWQDDIIGNKGDFTGGGTPSKSNFIFWRGDIPWVSSSDISEDSIHHIKISRFITKDAIKNSATKIVPKNSLLIVSRVGVGKLAVSKKEICTSQDFTNFTPSKDDLVFLGYYLKARNEILLGFSQGMAIKGFTKDDIFSLKLCFPDKNKEQQTIANCLSTIDNLIEAQAEKLDSLKDHKKGLMQRLFPKINDNW